ncbi:hypothetical protein GCM10010464_75280 [Pseudonocardia yunnanensis]
MRSLRADGAPDATPARKRATAWPGRLLAKPYWTVKSVRDGGSVNRLQFPTLDANPLRASLTSMRPIAAAISREVRAAGKSR